MENRKQKEKDLHNLIRDEKLMSSDDFEYYTSNKKWYSVVRSSRSFVEKWLRKNCLNNRILDYCCGNGGMSLTISELGAREVVGIDISEVSIENARNFAIKTGPDKRVSYYVMDAENMTLGDNSFDVIYESGVLHHLNLKKAYSELARVLKPGGEVICIEALGHNPIIQLYRRKTPHLRTEWETEHILHKEDIELARQYFNKVEILGFFHLTVLAAVPFRNTFLFNPILKIMEGLDSVLMKIPVVKWQAWQVVFVLAGPKKMKSHE